MKVAVIGAGGIIGQHMMVTVPSGIEATFTRRVESHLYRGLDLTHVGKPDDFLSELMPDIVVNLAGESRPDEVEKYLETSIVNVEAVSDLSNWCDKNGKHLIHVSSQAVLDPVNEYGRQKLRADRLLETSRQNWTIVRPTFVLGIRPFPGIGRENPAERMLSGQEHQSVDDRYFAVSFAWDVAEYIWKLCQGPVEKRKLHYVGNPERMSRYELAILLATNKDIVPIKHSDLPGLAPRPRDTSAPYANAFHTGPLSDGLIRLRAEWRSREEDDLSYRAKELAAFLKVPYWVTVGRLLLGFIPLHEAVTEDFNRANPKTDEELVAWYRTTDAYLWELTSYHSDKGFNYQNMVEGFAAALKSMKVKRVLCLGDGTGDLSIAMARVGIKPIYNDLFMSRIESFALSRFLMRYGDDWRKTFMATCSEDFVPFFERKEYHESLNKAAVVSMDFMEHLPNPDRWVRAIYNTLCPGGYFITKDTFNEGSGEHGAMPMHLACNDHWAEDWDELLKGIGFEHVVTNWYQKPENV